MRNKILNKILNLVVERNPNNLKAEKFLYLKKGYQIERFNKLKEEIKSNYNSIPKGNEDFVIPFWVKYMMNIEKKDIDFNFFRITEIEGTMIPTTSSLLCRRQLKYFMKKLNNTVGQTEFQACGDTTSTSSSEKASSVSEAGNYRELSRRSQ